MDTKKQATRLIKIIEEVNGYSRKKLDEARHTLYWYFDKRIFMGDNETTDILIRSIYSQVLYSPDFYNDLYEYFYAWNHALKRPKVYESLSIFLFRKFNYYNEEDFELMLEFNELLKDVYGIDLTDIQYIPRQKIDINYLREKYNITNLSTTSW